MHAFLWTMSSDLEVKSVKATGRSLEYWKTFGTEVMIAFRPYAHAAARRGCPLPGHIAGNPRDVRHRT